MWGTGVAGGGWRGRCVPLAACGCSFLAAHAALSPCALPPDVSALPPHPHPPAARQPFALGLAQLGRAGKPRMQRLAAPLSAGAACCVKDAA